MAEGSSSSYSYAEKKDLCDRLSELPPSSLTKEIYALIQDYARKDTTPQIKRLGTNGTTPFGARKVGDDYTFEINNLPIPLLQTIERLLETE